MARLWKIPGAVAELTVGTMIVLYQLTVARALDDRDRRDAPLQPLSPPSPLAEGTPVGGTPRVNLAGN